MVCLSSAFQTPKKFFGRLGALKASKASQQGTKERTNLYRQGVKEHLITSSLSFDDVLLEPKYSTVESRKEIDVSTENTKCGA